MSDLPKIHRSASIRFTTAQLREVLAKAGIIIGPLATMKLDPTCTTLILDWLEKEYEYVPQPDPEAGG